MQNFLNCLKYAASIISRDKTNLDVDVFVFRRKENEHPKLMISKKSGLFSEASVLELSIDVYPRVYEYKDAEIAIEESLKVKKWIAFNLDLLLDYWNYKLNLNQLIRKLKKYDESMPDPTPPVRATMDTSLLSEEDKKTMCYSKKAYKTLQLARKCAKKCKVRYDVDFYIYMCPLCGEYHFTAHKWDGVLYC